MPNKHLPKVSIQKPQPKPHERYKSLSERHGKSLRRWLDASAEPNLTVDRGRSEVTATDRALAKAARDLGEKIEWGGAARLPKDLRATLQSMANKEKQSAKKRKRDDQIFRDVLLAYLRNCSLARPTDTANPEKNAHCVVAQVHKLAPLTVYSIYSEKIANPWDVVGIVSELNPAMARLRFI